MTCFKCGAYNPDDANYCNKCGEKIEPYSTSYNQQQKSNDKKRRSLVIVMVSAMLALGLAVALMFIVVQRPKMEKRPAAKSNNFMDKK